MAIAQLPAYDEFVDFITSAPSLEEISLFRLSDSAESRISFLLEQNRQSQITDTEEQELDEYLRLEHIMRQMKIRAFEKLNIG